MIANLHGVRLVLAQESRRVEEQGAGVADERHRATFEGDAIDRECLGKVKLDAGCVLEHAEADEVVAGD